MSNYTELIAIQQVSKKEAEPFVKEIDTMIKGYLPKSIIRVYYDDNLVSNITIQFAAKPFNVTIQNDPYWINIYIYGQSRYMFTEPFKLDYSGGNRALPFRRVSGNKAKIMGALTAYFSKMRDKINEQI
jgi:hypothetical protein